MASHISTKHQYKCRFAIHHSKIINISNKTARKSRACSAKLQGQWQISSYGTIIYEYLPKQS